MFQTSLKPEDVKFFNSVLYQYEKEGKCHIGIPTRKYLLKSKIKSALIHDTNKDKIELKFPETLNTLCFKGECVCATLLKHLRHSLAHASIEREGEYYVVNSDENPKCKICGKVKRKDLMNLVNGILATKIEK